MTPCLCEIKDSSPVYLSYWRYACAKQCYFNLIDVHNFIGAKHSHLDKQFI